MAALLLVLLAAVWIFRMPIAGWAAQKWCRANDFDCQLQITAFGSSGLEAEHLRLRASDGNVPLEVEAAKVDWRWDGFLKPVVSRIEVTRPTLRGEYRPGTSQPIRFGELESLSSGGGGSQPLPEIALSEATVEIETPAGPLVGHGSFSGNLPYQGDLEITLSPVELASGEDRLVLREGHADLRFNGLQLNGTVRLDLEAANFDDIAARDVSLSAEVAGTVFSQIEWRAEIGRFGYGEVVDLSGANLSGTLKPAPGSDDRPSGLLAHVQSAALSGTLERLETRAVTAGPAEVTVDLARDGADSLTAEFALRAEALSHESTRTGLATLSGTANTDNRLSNVEASGDIVAEDAAITGDLRQQIVSAVTLGAPLEAHASALKAWLDAGLAGFSLGTGFDARFQKDGSDWSLVSTRAISLKAGNGAMLRLEPRETHPALNISPSQVEMSGLLTVSGGGGPEMVALVRSARFATDAPVRLETGGVSLEPWTANGLTLSADLDEITLTLPSGPTRLKTVGELRIDGPLYGMRFDDTHIFGGIEAVFDTGGVRVQTYQTDCLGVGIERVSVNSGFGIGETSLQLCPVDGRVVRQTGGVASGAVTLGDVSLPFTAQETSGTLSLEAATLDWRAGGNARISVDAETIRLPLEIGGKKLVLAASSPALAVQSGRPAHLSAKLGRTEFSGSVIPADLSLAGADFEADLANSGLQGTASATRVEMRDPGEDPLYQPLTGELSAEFSDGVMTVSGPISTPKAARPVATAQMTLDLGTLDGEARIATERLQFEPGGLQPTALSDRVRGFLSNARGTLEGEANFEIDGGMPSGQGWVSVSDFGFDTLRVGEVSGVEGRLEFNDIIALTTPPGQEVRVGRINPGIPLENGRISFQLLNGRKAIIEEARWPFAGGELIVGETGWTIAGTSDTIRITASQLELSQIINVFNLPDIRATGTVSGEFPVDIEGPNAYVRDATLKADETGGEVAYTGDIADAASQADQRVRMAFDALRDFHFSVLELGANGNLSGDMLVTLKLIGQSPEVLDGAPFAFNIGVDSKLMQLIQSGRSVTTSDWLVDAVKGSASGEGADGSAKEEAGSE